jgi:CheY-like chemotaxis protein
MALSLMIVDNDQVNSFVLKNVIKRNYPDAHVEMFADGEQALNRLSSIHHDEGPFPDVVLLDLYMPILNGFDFLEMYSEKFSHKKTLIFAMSNSLSKEDQQRANDFKVVKGFITKPLMYNNLQFIIETYLDVST